MSTQSTPGGAAANGSTAALVRPASTPAPVITLGGPSMDPDTLEYVLSKDCAGGARNHTALDAGKYYDLP